MVIRGSEEHDRTTIGPSVCPSNCDGANDPPGYGLARGPKIEPNKMTMEEAAVEVSHETQLAAFHAKRRVVTITIVIAALEHSFVYGNSVIAGSLIEEFTPTINGEFTREVSGFRFHGLYAVTASIFISYAAGANVPRSIAGVVAPRNDPVRAGVDHPHRRRVRRRRGMSASCSAPRA